MVVKIDNRQMINTENELNSNNLLFISIIFNFSIIFVNQTILKKKIQREIIIAIINNY